MKKILLWLVGIACVAGLAGFLFWPSEYDENVVEHDFSLLCNKGFDDSIVTRLKNQFTRSDASFTLHFVAVGYRTYRQNPSAFINPKPDPRWEKIRSIIQKDGATCFQDWFGNPFVQPGAGANSRWRIHYDDPTQHHITSLDHAALHGCGAAWV